MIFCEVAPGECPEGIEFYGQFVMLFICTHTRTDNPFIKVHLSCHYIVIFYGSEKA